MYVVEMYRKSGIKKCEEKRCEKMQNQGRGKRLNMKRKKERKIYRTEKKNEKKCRTKSKGKDG